MVASVDLRPPHAHRTAFLIRPLAFVALCAGSLLTGCASQPQQYRTAGTGGGVDSRYGVRASPRVVAEGEPVPKGGGYDMIGKPYVVAGRTYYPSAHPHSAVGFASWYGSDFHGRRTANGEVFDRLSLSAAHPTMPLPSYARVTNLRNSRSIIVRVNDRGPYHENRIMDVSQRVAEALEFERSGTSRVRVDYVGRASLAGSDDAKLLATLRTDGQPAGLEGTGASSPTMVAQRSPEPEPREIARPAPALREAVHVASIGRTHLSAAPEEDREDVATASTATAAYAVSARIAFRPVDLRTIPGASTPIAASRPVPGRAAPRTIEALLAENAPVPPRR